MRSLLKIFKRAERDCVVPTERRACRVRRTDLPAHPPVFSPFCRSWEKKQERAALSGEERKKKGWDELLRILSFADKRERGEKESAARTAREPQTLRCSEKSEEEFFPECSARIMREPQILRRSEKSEGEFFPERSAHAMREPQTLRRSEKSEEEFFPERSARIVREPQGLRRSEKSEEELFPELSALRGFNMEERGMRRGGWEG